VTREHLTRRGQFHAVRQALEQRHAGIGFELDELAIDGRGGHTQLTRGLADRAIAADCVKVRDRAIADGLAGGAGHN